MTESRALLGADAAGLGDEVLRDRVELEVFIGREDAERFIEEVRGDDPDMGRKPRIEEQELEAGGLNQQRELDKAIYLAHRRTAALPPSPNTADYGYGRWCTCPLRPREGRIVVGETDSCTRSTASAARSLAWSISPSGAVEPNTVYVIAPLCKTSSTTSHSPGKRPGILTPGFGAADTHRISDESGVINTRQMFGSRDTAYVFDPAEP